MFLCLFWGEFGAWVLGGDGLDEMVLWGKGWV